MVTANPSLEQFILMDEGAIEARPNATDFSRRYGPNLRKGEPIEFTAFLNEVEIDGWGSVIKYAPVQRRSMKHNNVNPKEYALQFDLGDEELETENVLFIPYLLTQIENFKLTFPAVIGRRSSQEASFLIAMSIRNLAELEESDFKAAFNTFGRNAPRFGFTDRLDFTTDNMMRENAIVYRVNVKRDYTIALADLKKGIQGLFKVYKMLAEKVISARREAELAEQEELEEQEAKESLEAQKAAHG